MSTAHASWVVAEGLGNALFWTDGQRRGVGGGGPGAADNSMLLLG